MKRRLDDKPNSGGGGGYNIPQYTGKKADNTMSNIAAGMGIPAGIALVASRVGEGDRNAAQREKAADAKRASDAEMKRESRGVAKPANFDAMEESKRDAQDARDRKKISEMGYKSGGKVSSASSRADGCATKGKTKGTMITMKNGGMC
jgi:hypothetical protein